MLTENYIVCFGYYADPAVDAMCYRKTLRTNIYDPMLDDIHYFSCNDEVFSVTNTTALGEDNIITSYLYIEPMFNYCFTHLRTFDIDNDVMTYSQEYFQIDKSAPTGITYIPVDNSAVIMHEYNLGGALNSNFIHIDPFPPMSYITRVDFFPSKYFHSITTHANDYYLASNGAIWFYRDKMYSTYTSSCPNMDEMRLWMLENINHAKINYPLGSQYNPPIEYNPSTDVFTSTTSADCSH
jgi:hypothetical protein